MNPFHWPQRYQVLLIAGALLGGYIGPILGYGIYLLRRGDNARSFEWWFNQRWELSLLTIIVGLIAGALIVVAIKRRRDLTVAHPLGH